jgi:hypothetical protein
MKILLRFLTCIFAIGLCFLSFCSAPNNSSTEKTSIQIHNIWFSEQVDADLDGYFSQSLLHINLELLKGSHEIFIRIYSRAAEAADTTALTLYYQTEVFKIIAGSNIDTAYIRLGYPDVELNQGLYDLFACVYNPLSPDFILAEATPLSHSMLRNIAVENEFTDARLSITDAVLLNRIDYDGDGFYSSFEMRVKITSSKYNRIADLVMHAKPGSGGNYIPIDTVKNITLTDTITTTSITFNSKYIAGNNYDLKLEANFEDNATIEDVFDKDDNPDLGNVLMESADDEEKEERLLAGHDNTFEDIISYENRSYAVRFNQPSGAIKCTIDKVRLHCTVDPAYIDLALWDDKEGLPQNEIFLFQSQKYVNDQGWNEYITDFNIADYNTFYVVFDLYADQGPAVSVDGDPPHNESSFYKNPNTGIWEVKADGDIAVEVLVAYYTGSGNGGNVVKKHWIKSTHLSIETKK